MFCAPQPKIQRRPRTSVGAERKNNEKATNNKCPGRFCAPLQIHTSPFVQIPYKLLALEHAASRLRPSKRWAVTETSLNVKDRYRLGEMAMVCKECFNEYASRQVSRDELRKTMTNDVFKGITFKKASKKRCKEEKTKMQKNKIRHSTNKKSSEETLVTCKKDLCLFCCKSVQSCEC